MAAAKQQEAEEKAAQAAKIEAGRELLATVIAGGPLLCEQHLGFVTDPIQ